MVRSKEEIARNRRIAGWGCGLFAALLIVTVIALFMLTEDEQVWFAPQSASVVQSIDIINDHVSITIDVGDPGSIASLPSHIVDLLGSVRSGLLARSDVADVRTVTYVFRRIAPDGDVRPLLVMDADWSKFRSVEASTNIVNAFRRVRHRPDGQGDQLMREACSLHRGDLNVENLCTSD